MGLLDSLLASALGGAQGQGQGSQGAILMQLALQLLGGGANARGGSGLTELIQQFQQAGLGSQMNSWIGTGQNMPISPDQLMQVFGQGRLQQMAASSGLGVDQVSSGLSDLLPQLIDHVTPHGQVPEQGLDSALADLSRLMPR